MHAIESDSFRARPRARPRKSEFYRDKDEGRRSLYSDTLYETTIKKFLF
jgi:hypothetical protein